MNRLGSRKGWSWVAGGLAGLTLGLSAALLPSNDPAVEWDPYAAATRSTPGDRIRTAAEHVGEAHFWAAPEVADRLTAEEIRSLQHTAAEAEVPTFVVYWGDYDIAPSMGFNTDYAAVDQLMATVGVDGVYAIVDSRGSVVTEGLGYDLGYVDAGLLDGRPGAALHRWVDALVAESAEPEGPDSGSDFDYWGGPWGGLAAGLLIVVPSLALLVGTVAAIGAATRPKNPTHTPNDQEPR